MSRALCLVASLVLLGCPAGRLPTPRPTEVGTPVGTLAEKTLGAAGGSLASADGLLTLEVPAGALSADVKLGIQPLTNTAPNGLGAGYRLSPEGTTFAAPVKLTFKPPATMLAGTTLALAGIATQDASHVWRWLHGVARDEAAGISVTTTHFSDWSLVAGAQLRPPSARVDTGNTVTLTAVDCFTVESGEELAPLFDCSETELAPQPMSLSGWAVNGVAGGSAVTGTVAGQGLGATFKAPSKAPDPATVAVSVEAANVKIDGQTFPRATLVSNVTIGGQSAYAGTFTLTYQESTGGITTSFTASGTAQLARPVTGSTGTRFSLTESASTAQIANFRQTSTDLTCTAASAPASFTSGVLTLRASPNEHALSLSLAGSAASHCVPNGQPAFDANKAFTANVGQGSTGDCTEPKFVPSSADQKVLTGSATWACTIAAGHTLNATFDWNLTSQ